MMEEHEDKITKFMQRLMGTHKWRYSVQIGQAVDARLTGASRGSATAAARTTRTTRTIAEAEGANYTPSWQEARVAQVDEESVEVGK